MSVLPLKMQSLNLDILWILLRNNFDSYTVNGHAYPKSDITTKASNGKYAFEHMDDVDKATMTVDETVEVTGKIGDEEINQVIKYKSTTKLH